MANQIAAEAGALQAGQQAVAEAHQNIDNQIKNIRGEIDALSGYWKGDAANAYTQLVQSWDEKSSQLNAILITLQENLNKTEKAQEATEHEHEQSVSSIQSLLN